MPRCIHMRTIMRGQLEHFDRPSFAVRQIGFLQSGEEHGNLFPGVLMRHICDFGTHDIRIGNHIIGDRDGQIDEPGHPACRPSSPSRNAATSGNAPSCAR